MKVEINNEEMYMDGYLKSNFDIVKHMVKQDWDMLIIVDGVEGTGKSVLAQQCAYYCDPTLDLSRITFNANEFQNAIRNAKKYEAVVFDEAYSGLSSRGAMTQVNRALVSMISQIRQKNLFVFIVMPCFFEVDKYFAVWRSRALLHVYTGDRLQRGYFAFFNSAKKRTLYIKGKKLYQYLVSPNFRGRFTKGYVVNEKEYRKKKLDSLEQPTGTDLTYIGQRNSIIKVLSEDGWTRQKIADAINKYGGTEFTRETIKEVIKKFRPRSSP